jgi:hypothetical protein
MPASHYHFQICLRDHQLVLLFLLATTLDFHTIDIELWAFGSSQSADMDWWLYDFGVVHFWVIFL